MKKIKALLLVSLLTLSMTMTACGRANGSANGTGAAGNNGAGQSITEDNAGDAMDGTASDVNEAMEDNGTDHDNVNDVTAGDTAEGDSLLNDVGDAVGDVGEAAADVIDGAAKGVEKAVDGATDQTSDSAAGSGTDTHSAASR